MTIKIDIIKTNKGYEYVDPGNMRMLGEIRQSRNNPNKFDLLTPGWKRSANGLDEALRKMRGILSKSLAYYADVVEFTNI